MKRGMFACLLAGSLLLTATPAIGGTLVQFRTTLGDMVVELYDQDKPVTVANFIRYVEAGRYTNTFLHRCVPGFVAQGGGFGAMDPTSTSPLTSLTSVAVFDPITNEFSVGPYYGNVYGTIAMAKTTNSPDTATSQWFFNLANNTAILDGQNGGFTVFGRVIQGTNVLEQFNMRSACYGLVNLGGVLSELPVLYAGCVWPQYQHLIYADVQLLEVDLHGAGAGGCNLHWNSVAGMTNIVEYADCLSPDSWHPLLSTNADGGMLSATDAELGATSRFYRVRVQ